MTIICYKDGMLAGDGMESINNIETVSIKAKKIVTAEPGDVWTVYGKRIVAFGLSGTCSTIYILQDLLRRGIYEQTLFYRDDKKFFSAICVTEDLVAYRMSPTESHDEKYFTLFIQKDDGIPSAVGTGTAVARFSMGPLKKSAKQAVELVCGHYHGCGGEIQVVDIAQLVAELREKEKALPEDFVFTPDEVIYKPRPVEKEEAKSK